MTDNEKTIRTLIDYQNLVDEQRGRIKDLAYLLYTGQEEEVRKTANKFAIDNEEIYLDLKRLIYDLQGIRIDNRFDAVGTTDSFPAALEENEAGIWRFHLPPFFSVQSSERGASNAGKHIYYLMLKLQEEYEASTKKIERIKMPIIIFEHHICSDFQKVFDFDNIDSKRALDAMQGVFIDDDNALSLVTVNMAVKDPKESYCDIYIADRNDPAIYQKLVETGSKKPLNN